VLLTPSDNATQDILDATTTQKGKSQLAAVAPGAISSTGAAGTGNAVVANADHTHEGVHSLGIDGDPTESKGDVKLLAGTNVAIDYSVGKIRISTSGSTVGCQEVPAGLVNGVNTMFGPLSQTVINQNSTLVMLDGLIVDKALWTLVGNSIQFATAPEFGQSVYVFYLYNGVAPIPPTPTGNENLEYRTLTPLEITNGQLTLAATPSTPGLVRLDTPGGFAVFGTDFTVAGNLLVWSGFALSGLLAELDQVRIGYWS
jgi:hypothetical protein